MTCSGEKKRGRVCTWTDSCAFVTCVDLFSSCPQTPPPVAAASSLVGSKMSQGRVGGPCNSQLWDPHRSLCSSFHCVQRVWEPPSSAVTTFPEQADTQKLIKLKKRDVYWLCHLGWGWFFKSSSMPCTLGKLHIGNTCCFTLTYKNPWKKSKYDKVNAPRRADMTPTSK